MDALPRVFPRLFHCRGSYIRSAFAMTHSCSRRGPAGGTNGIPAPTGELAVGCVDLMHQVWEYFDHSP